MSMSSTATTNSPHHVPETSSDSLLRRAVGGARSIAPQLIWGIISVALFASVWELSWFVGWSDPRLLPPPHIFLSNLPDQSRFFMSAQRWQIGSGEIEAPSGASAVALTVIASMMRVFAGLFLATMASLVVGVAIKYWKLVGNLLLPTITLLAPVSPIAWLPVAIFAFGIGDKPAIFMVFIALFFVMTLSTVTQIETVDTKLVNVASIMGATKWQLHFHVILPAVLPGLLVVLRLNLFAAWMAVLVAEATGVGYGLGQVIMVARNTLNPGLIFFTMIIIGAIGFISDAVLRGIQRRVLYWVPKGYGALG